MTKTTDISILHLSAVSALRNDLAEPIVILVYWEKKAAACFFCRCGRHEPQDANGVPLKNRNKKTENRKPTADLYSQLTSLESHHTDTRVMSEVFELDIFIRCN